MLTWLASVVVLAFVMAATPGPNNVLFAASGARAGYLRTLPGLVGMLGGFAAILGACALGVGELVARAPMAQVAMTVLASCYMLWLGLKLWHAPASSPKDSESQLLTWGQMAAFQVLNVKTWLACIAFASGYLAGNSPGGIAFDLVGITAFLVVVLLSASLWTLFGAAFRARLQPRHWQVFNRVLAALALATIVTFWL